METSESLFSENDGEIYRSDSAKEDMKYMEEASIWIGSLSIVFSLVFIWNAVELGTYSSSVFTNPEFSTHSVLKATVYKQHIIKKLVGQNECICNFICNFFFDKKIVFSKKLTFYYLF
jgi:hypothetical protein